jgi:release factor glutamine methyltransferase
MKVKAFHNSLVLRLQKKYSERESLNIARWLITEKTSLNADSNEDISIRDRELLERSVDRLAQGEPLDYILGNTSFYGRSFIVNEHVLIPRPETEELVEQCVFDVRGRRGGVTNVLDIGTGSGCIAITIQKEVDSVNILGVDISEEALKVALVNKKKLDANVRFELHDILDKTKDTVFGMFHLIVSNPPYISKEEKQKMGDSTIQFEPHIALFPEGKDPLIFYRRISDFALTNLLSGGSLWFEMNEFYAREIKEILVQKGFQEVSIFSDLQGKARMIKGIKP